MRLNYQSNILKNLYFDELFTDSYINLVDWLERINEISQANYI